MKQWLVSELTVAVENELQEMGYAQHTVHIYLYYGLRPIKQYYESIGEKLYSEEITNEYVNFAQTQLDILEEKRRVIRKTASILSEYAKSEKITWKQLTARNAKKLSPSYLLLLEKFSRQLTENGYRSVRGRKSVIKQFLHHLEEHEIFDLSQVTKEDILVYLEVIADKYSRPGGWLSVLRHFLSSLYEQQLISANFSHVLSVSVPKPRKFYYGFAKQEVADILGVIDRNTPLGKRNYAIIMLASSTGIRAVDVFNMKFCDIDWIAKEISIVQQKTDKALILPIETNVCNAIADYILNGRPNGDTDYIFLRSKAPYEKMKSHAKMINRIAAKAGITWHRNEHKGFHGFRRSIGNWMLEAEIPLSTISEILGHARKDSSKPYLMTHHTNLAMCALPLQGIETTRGELQ